MSDVTQILSLITQYCDEHHLTPRESGLQVLEA